MFTRRAHFIKHINEPAGFIISETEPFAIECCGKTFDLFGIIPYPKNKLFQLTGVYTRFKPDRAYGRWYGIEHKLKIAKLPEIRPVPACIFSMDYRVCFFIIIFITGKPAHHHLIRVGSLGFDIYREITVQGHTGMV